MTKVLTDLLYESLIDDSEELDKAYDKIKQLQEQLKEANIVITSYIRNNPLEKYGPAEAYCERWQVK